MRTFLGCTTFFSRLGLARYCGVVFSDNDLYFPAGFFDDGPLSMFPRRIRWSHVKSVGATYDNEGKVSSVVIALFDGSNVTMKISAVIVLNPEAEVLYAFAHCVEDKLTPDVLSRYKEHVAASFQRGLKALAERSEEDARVVAVMTELAQQGAGAPEIMQAIFDVRYGDKGDQNVEPDRREQITD